MGVRAKSFFRYKDTRKRDGLQRVHSETKHVDKRDRVRE